MDTRLESLINWIRQTTDTAAGRGVVVSVSGGSDSALCFWLCAKALPPGRAIAVHFGDHLRCQPWFEALGPVHLLPAPAGVAGKDAEALRWAAALSHARTMRGWLVGSRNRTEEVLGTYSLASRLATCLPLAGLWKSDVMALCAEPAVAVPTEIMESSQRADPACERPREIADIPFADVDRLLQVELSERPPTDLATLSPACITYLGGVLQRNRFKRDLPLKPPHA
jgi:NH3-dependent NAD+ synthetase